MRKQSSKLKKLKMKSQRSRHVSFFRGTLKPETNQASSENNQLD